MPLRLARRRQPSLAENPPTAESKESDGEQREGDICQGNGFGRVGFASSVEFERMQEPGSDANAPRTRGMGP
nr:MAG TPA: hypothetical protein [Caudoviricetes sp.]